MEYVSKEAVLTAIADQMKRDSDNEQWLIGWKQALSALQTTVETMEPSTADVDAAELAFRKPMEPIRAREDLVICPSCKKKINDGHSYCKRCGQAILWKRVI